MNANLNDRGQVLLVAFARKNVWVSRRLDPESNELRWRERDAICGYARCKMGLIMERCVERGARDELAHVDSDPYACRGVHEPQDPERVASNRISFTSSIRRIVQGDWIEGRASSMALAGKKRTMQLDGPGWKEENHATWRCGTLRHQDGPVDPSLPFFLSLPSSIFFPQNARSHLNALAPDPLRQKLKATPSLILPVRERHRGGRMTCELWNDARGPWWMSRRGSGG